MVLGIGFDLRENIHRFECHPANRADAGTNLNNLRMHGAGVANLFLVWRRARCRRGGVFDRSRSCRCGTMFHSPGAGSRQKFPRVLGKPFGTALRTKVVCLSRTFNFAGRFFRNNHHSANGVLVLGW